MSGDTKNYDSKDAESTIAKGDGKTMRILFEVLLLSVVIGAVVVFYKIVISYLFPKKKEKSDGE